MKGDRLEQYIRNNRADFDTKNPRPELWYEIDQKIRKKNKKFTLGWHTMGIAASIVLLLGFGIGWMSHNQNVNQNLYASVPEIADFPDIERYYLTEISAKTSELEALGIEPSVEDNLKQLDEVYQELKAELAKTDDKNKAFIVNAMINNYKTKIEILELILGRSKEAIQQEKSMENETIKI